MPIIGRGWRRGLVVPLALVVILLMAACDAGEDGELSATVAETVADQPTVIVAASELPQETPTAPPTVVVPTVTPTATPPAPLAAMVNGQYVFLADYERQVAQYEQALQEMGVDLSTAEGQAELAQARQDVREGLIDEVLIEQGGSELGVGLSEEELEGQIEADIVAGGGQAAFEEWLEATGQTREDYKRMLRRALISQRVWEIVAADVPQAVEQVHVRVIVVDSEEEAQQILSSLREGADFVALARERSVDLATKDNGGDLGWFPRGVVAVELEGAAFALQPGEVSQPVAIGEGFHIVQVVEREASWPLSEEMSLYLKQDRFDQWLKELRAKAVIERFVGE